MGLKALYPWIGFEPVWVIGSLVTVTWWLIVRRRMDVKQNAETAGLADSREKLGRLIKIIDEDA